MHCAACSQGSGVLRRILFAFVFSLRNRSTPVAEPPIRAMAVYAVASKHVPHLARDRLGTDWGTFLLACSAGDARVISAPKAKEIPQPEKGREVSTTCAPILELG